MTELTKKVQNGELDGSILWVSQYSQPDIDKKPLRSVPPTKCIVKSNDKLPKGKTVYYSKSHFVALGKNDCETKKIISPVDNTGFRLRQGNPINTFENESDCIKSWNEDLSMVIKKLNDKSKVIIDEINGQISKLEDMEK